MLYIICKSKNKIADYEKFPKFNTDNWEIVETVNCRKNATRKAYDSIFCPIYVRLSKKFKKDDSYIRLWTFKEEEVFPMK